MKLTEAMGVITMSFGMARLCSGTGSEVECFLMLLFGSWFLFNAPLISRKEKQ